MLYLAPYVGVGTEPEPFRPWGVDAVQWWAIDLRPDPTVADGWALLRVDEPLADTSELHLLGELDEVPRFQDSRQVERNLGLEQDVLRDLSWRQIIADLLIVHGEDIEPKGRWKRLVPDLANRLRIHLGELIFDMPVPEGGATVTDDFNRADASTLGADWVEVGGDWEILNNRARQSNRDGGVVSQGSYARHVTALDGDDQYAEVLSVSTNFSGTVQGPAARMSDVDETYYVAYHRRNDDSIDDLLSKVVNGTRTTLANATSPSAEATVRLVCDGNSIEMLLDGAAHLSATDTAILGPRFVGMVGHPGGSDGQSTFDDFEAADLAAAGVSGTLDQTAPAFTQSAEAAASVDGAVSQDAPAFSQDVAANVAVAGAIAQDGPAFVQSATADVTVTATVGQAAPAYSQVVAGDVTVTVTLDQSGPVFTQAVEGSSAATFDPANLAATVDGGTVSLSWDTSPLVPA